MHLFRRKVYQKQREYPVNKAVNTNPDGVAQVAPTGKIFAYGVKLSAKVSRTKSAANGLRIREENRANSCSKAKLQLLGNRIL